MKKTERAVIMALDSPDIRDLDVLLEELKLLLSNLGIVVVEQIIQRRRSPDPAYMMGKGKIEMIAIACQELKADLVVSDERLTPTQIANISEITKTEVWDRAFVIMKIFEARAHTAEAKLQVELARCRYEIPLLKGLGNQMSRTGGGLGTRGPGETEFERHRRKLERRRNKIKKRLKLVEKRRDHQRKRRQKTQIPVVSLVGYTNSGKSTLLKKMSSDNSLETSDRLFATLDTFTRRVPFEDGGDILVSDTVGFIRGLPKDLVAAFNTTLEEVQWSDLLLLLVDSSSPDALEHFEVVQKTLFDIGASTVPRMIVLNKMDMVENSVLQSYVDRFTQSGEKVVAVSSLKGHGIDDLKNCIKEILNSIRK